MENGLLEELEITYETYGSRNADGSNCILICHALTGDHHAAGFHSHEDQKKGWWDHVIGPGKAIDTNLFLCGLLQLPWGL